MKRVGWIDYAKSTGIFLVVLLHTHCTYATTSFLSAFRLPLFFFISGFLFSYRSNPDYKRFAYKRFRQLVVPYLWINLLAYVAWLLVLRHFGNDAGDTVAWHKPLWAIVAGIPPGLVHDIPLWSLLCFFVVEMIYYPLRKKVGHGWLIAVAAWAVSYLNCEYNSEHVSTLPFCLGPAFAALGFYAFGNYVRDNSSRFGFMLRPRLLTLSVSSVSLVALWWHNSAIQFFICDYGSYPLFVLEGIFGIAAMMQVCMYLCEWFGDNGFVRFVSNGTLIICGFHLMMFSLIKGVMWFGFHVDPQMLTCNFERGFLFSVVAFSLCLPVICVVNRHFRFLVGK